MTTPSAAGALHPLSADWFRALAETTATAIFVYGMDRFHYVNRAAEELTGYTAEELLAMEPDDLVLPEYQPAARASRARRLGGDSTPARFELGIRRKDGEPRWLLFSAALIDWYKKNSADRPIGFFQIGGGIAGDFPICVVPMLHQDLHRTSVPLWGYFCQISDSTTSYGSYSGAVPNEKITWGKLGIDTPKFIIESDATIVAPLLFAYVLEW